jgi:phage protein D
VLEDTAGTLAIPGSGARLEVSLGYNGRNARVGSFVVDDVTLDGPPDLVTIRASSTPFVSDRNGSGNSGFNSKKSRSFEGKTIGDIVSTVAGECGLTPVVDQSLKSVTIPHISQVSETDANLLLRIARRYGAILKPADGRLVLALEAGGQTTSGKPLELALTPGDVSRYTFKLGGKMQGVTKVRAKVHSYTTGETEDVEIDVDKETTKQTVKSTAKRIARSKKQCTLTLLGNISLVAGMHVNLTGFRQGNSGRYKVLTVRQSVSRSGWTTSLTCEGA